MFDTILLGCSHGNIFCMYLPSIKWLSWKAEILPTFSYSYVKKIRAASPVMEGKDFANIFKFLCEKIRDASWQSQQNDCAPREDSDQPCYLPSLISLCCVLNGWMPRLIWVFGGHTVILLVLSWGSSNFNLNFTRIMAINSTWQNCTSLEYPMFKIPFMSRA